MIQPPTVLQAIAVIGCYELGNGIAKLGRWALRKWREHRRTRGPLRNRRIGFYFADEVDEAEGNTKRHHGQPESGKGHTQ